MIKHKLFSEAGESIAETLVALLISSLALLMLAGAVTTATRVIGQSTDKMNAYYLKDTAMISGEGEDSSITVTINISNIDDDVYPSLPDSTFPVDGYSNDTFPAHTVYAYTTAEAHTGG